MRAHQDSRSAAVLAAVLRSVRIAVAGLFAMLALMLTYAAQQPSAARADTPEPCSTSVPGVSASFLPVLHEPTLSVAPIKGPSGSSATLHLTNFLPNQPVNAIFRVIGDPVVATGTTDALGEAYLPFTVPTAPDGVYWILAAQENRTCVHAAVHFEIGQVPPTPTSTPRPPTATTVAPTPTTPTTPPPTATPQIPVLGSGAGASGGSAPLNFGMAAAGCWVASAGFVFLVFGRRRRSPLRNRL
jgi:hypothetical protein